MEKPTEQRADARGADSVQRLVRRCGNCIHFGELKGIRGTVVNQVCLAPVTSEPPPNGVTAAKYRFVYVTSSNGDCELYTPNSQLLKPELPQQ